MTNDYDRLVEIATELKELAPRLEAARQRKEAADRKAEEVLQERRQADEEFSPIAGQINKLRAEAQRILNGVSETPSDPADIAIEELGLPNRAYNTLKRNGLMTIAQILELSEEELLLLPSFGARSYKQLYEQLESRGLPTPRIDRISRQGIPLERRIHIFGRPNSA